MQGITQDDCRKYMDGYRPFDYSKTQQNENMNISNNNTTNNVVI